jgi:hypothetical protein
MRRNERNGPGISNSEEDEAAPSFEGEIAAASLFTVTAARPMPAVAEK